MEQLFESQINKRLAVIYKHIIYRDMIDNQVARVLPGILKANRIQVKDAAMKYVIVSNEILTGEDAYPLQNQTAYVPLFFEDSVIMFQDTFGNRYMDVEYTKEPVLDERTGKMLWDVSGAPDVKDEGVPGDRRRKRSR